MPPRPEVEPNAAPGVRLQKVLADAGIGSRRACEEMIVAGRVGVNGRVVRELGTRVDPERDTLQVDGVRVPTRRGMTYLAVHKPRGMLSTMRDERGRRCLGDLVADREARLFHVGRLDADTEGLILLTNDGDLAHRMMHPSYGVQKTYLAEVRGPVPRAVGRRLRDGVVLDDGLARADAFRVVGETGGRVLVELVLHEGRKHIVRRLLAEVGHPVQRLVRTAVGPIQLDRMRPGAVRPLTLPEVRALHAAVGL